MHHVVGNHDLFGIDSKSGIAPGEPGYGTRMFEERFGSKTYYSFDHKGYHFILLDSIQPTENRSWEARIDEPQLAWLKHDLESNGPDAPVVVAVHVPLVTGAASYGPFIKNTSQLIIVNAHEVLQLFASAPHSCRASGPRSLQRGRELSWNSLHLQWRRDAGTGGMARDGERPKATPLSVSGTARLVGAMKPMALRASIRRIRESVTKNGTTLRIRHATRQG